MLVTALAPHIGYDRAAEIAKKAHQRGHHAARGGARPRLRQREGFRSLGEARRHDRAQGVNRRALHHRRPARWRCPHGAEGGVLSEACSGASRSAATPPSHIFGTIHDADARLARPAAAGAARLCARPHAAGRVPAGRLHARALHRGGTVPERQTLEENIGAEDFERAVEALGADRPDARSGQQAQALGRADQSARSAADAPEEASMRADRDARARRLAVDQIEGVEEQIFTFDECPMQTQVALLRHSLAHRDELRRARHETHPGRVSGARPGAIWRLREAIHRPLSGGRRAPGSHDQAGDLRPQRRDGLPHAARVAPRRRVRRGGGAAPVWRAAACSRCWSKMAITLRGFIDAGHADFRPGQQHAGAGRGGAAGGGRHQQPRRCRRPRSSRGRAALRRQSSSTRNSPAARRSTPRSPGRSNGSGRAWWRSPASCASSRPKFVRALRGACSISIRRCCRRSPGSTRMSGRSPRASSSTAAPCTS